MIKWPHCYRIEEDYFLWTICHQARWTPVRECGLVFVCKLPSSMLARRDRFIIKNHLIGIYAPGLQTFNTIMIPKNLAHPKLEPWCDCCRADAD